MAMIKCPECGQEISDKAKKCIHCGKIFVEDTKENICMECGKIIPEDSDLCPYCGCPVEKTASQKVEVPGIKVSKKSKKMFAIIGVVALVVCIIAICGGLYFKKVSEQKKIDEYNTYIDNVNSACDNMLSSAATGETICNLTRSVWYNAMEFLKKSKLDSEEYFDVAVFGYLLSVEIYLNDIDLQRKCKFEAVSYMYMRREMYLYFRTQKRNSAIGNNTSLDIMETNVADSSPMESITSLEYMEMIKQIQGRLTEEQWEIFSDKAKGYSLREISANHGINEKRIYKQFGKIKQIVAEIMEI